MNWLQNEHQRSSGPQHAWIDPQPCSELVFTRGAFIHNGWVCTNTMNPKPFHVVGYITFIGLKAIYIWKVSSPGEGGGCIQGCANGCNAAPNHHITSHYKWRDSIMSGCDTLCHGNYFIVVTILMEISK